MKAISICCFRMRKTTKKNIIALFHHFIDTSDRILILTSLATFRHNQFDIFKLESSNLLFQTCDCCFTVQVHMHIASDS